MASDLKLKPGGVALIACFAFAIVAVGVQAAWLAHDRESGPLPAQASSAAPVGTEASEARIAAERARLVRSSADIDALDAQIVAASDALAIAREDAARRTISRQDDRTRVDELNRKVEELRSKRAAAVRDYTISLTAVGSEATVGLPVHRQVQPQSGERE